MEWLCAVIPLSGPSHVERMAREVRQQKRAGLSGGHRMGQKGSTDDESPIESFKTLLETAAVAAGLIYGGFYWVLSRFYSNFGITPEDAGWNLQTTLARFAGFIAYALFWAGLALLAVRVWVWRNPRLKERASIMLIAMTGVLVAVSFGLLLATSQRWDDRVRAGRLATSSVYFSVPTPCVTVRWVDPGKMGKELSTFRFDGVTKFMLLGSTNIATLFAVNEKQVIRVPISLVVLTHCSRA